MYYCDTSIGYSVFYTYRTKANLPGNCKIALEANFAPNGIF